MSFQPALADCFLTNGAWDLRFVESHVSAQKPDFLSTNRAFGFLGMSQFVSLQIFFECSLEVAVVATQGFCLEMNIFQVAFQDTAIWKNISAEAARVALISMQSFVAIFSQNFYFGFLLKLSAIWCWFEV